MHGAALTCRRSGYVDTQLRPPAALSPRLHSLDALPNFLLIDPRAFLAALPLDSDSERIPGAIGSPAGPGSGVDFER